MTYSAEISRRNPTLFIIMLDQSGSMRLRWEPSSKSRSEIFAETINRFLYELVIRSTKAQDFVSYFDIAVFSYGSEIKSAIPQKTLDELPCSIEEIAENPKMEERIIREPDYAGRTLEKRVTMPVWIEPQANGGTPMRHAFKICRVVLQKWIALHSTSYPPIIINITGGESSDGNPELICRDISNLKTVDGNVLIFNIQIPTTRSSNKPIIFSSDEGAFPSTEFTQLFRMSSRIPKIWFEKLTTDGYQLIDDARGIVWNADLKTLKQIIEIFHNWHDLGTVVRYRY